MWGKDDFGDLKVHIHNLRAKVEEDPSSPRAIVRARGLGYAFMP